MGLFKPAWMSKDSKKARAAVAAINDSGQLLQIALDNSVPLDSVRRDAIGAITDQASIKKIVSDKSITPVVVRQEAVRKLTDKRFLKELIERCEEVEISRIALWCINDGDLVVQTIKENARLSDEALKIYLENHRDHPEFYDVLSEDFYQRTRGHNKLKISNYIYRLFEKFKSDDELEAIAMGARSELAMEAIGRLSSDAKLANIAQNAKWAQVREYCSKLNPVGGRIVGKDMPAGTYQFNGEGHVEIYRNRKCVLKQGTVYCNNDNVFHDTITFKCEDGDIVFNTANESQG